MDLNCDISRSSVFDEKAAPSTSRGCMRRTWDCSGEPTGTDESLVSMCLWCVMRPLLREPEVGVWAAIAFR